MTEETNTTSFFTDGLLNEIADRVVKKLTDSNSAWLNTIQYKVRAENIEGQIQASQIDGIEDMVEDCVTDKVKEVAGDAAEEVLRNASFDVNVSL